MSGISRGSTIIPSLRYRDAHAAIEWLCAVLGMTCRAVYPGPENTVAHAELTLGDGMLMLGSASNGGAMSDRWISVEEAGGRETSRMYVVVSEEECKAAYGRAQAAGATMVQELYQPEYGGLGFACTDPEGHIWSVGSYTPWSLPAQDSLYAGRSTKGQDDGEGPVSRGAGQ